MNKVIAAALFVGAGALCMVIGYRLSIPWKIMWYSAGLAHGVIAGYTLPRKSR